MIETHYMRHVVVFYQNVKVKWWRQQIREHVMIDCQNTLCHVVCYIVYMVTWLGLHV